MRTEIEPAIEDLERLVSRAAPEEIPKLLGQLESLQAVLWLRLREAPISGNGKGDPAEPDRFLTIKEAAALLKKPVRWFYRNQKSLPFMRPIGERGLRCSEKALDAYMKNRPGR